MGTSGDGQATPADDMGIPGDEMARRLLKISGCMNMVSVHI